VLDQVLSSYLGRTPGADEKANFLKLAQAQEKAHPSVSSSSSTTKSSNSGGYNSSSTSSTSSSGTSSGGFGAADVQNLAIQQAQADKGYAEYQYGTTYMNAFLSALGAPVSGAQGTV
jgi:hypothetical protein